MMSDSYHTGNTKQINAVIKGAELNYPDLTLHELLEKQAVLSPNAVALQFGDEFTTYIELRKRVNQMANYLEDQGVQPDQLVAVSLERSPDLIVCIFSILQCGAAYLPIDTGYPAARIELLISDSNAAFFITTKSKKELSHASKTIFIENLLRTVDDLPSVPLDLKVSTDSVAYIIYTSGSTGKPKGVQVAHRNVVNLLYSMKKEPGISSEDKIFALTTISFDAMVMEIFLPLIHGACVVLVDEETRRDGNLLLRKAENDEITMMWGTPSIWQILLDAGWEKPLKIKALCGGEPVPLPLAHKLLSKCNELWNIYGPTETTVCCFLTKISKDDDPITVGKPVANTQAYFLDEKGNPVGLGEVGEIAIGGDGVSLGYLNGRNLPQNVL